MNDNQNCMTDRRLCPACGRIVSGRANKKYCDDNCRNNYYYKTYSEQLHYVRSINEVLLRNRMILKELNQCRRIVVSKQSLVEKNFDFNHFTGVWKSKKGKVYYVVYEESYALNDNETVDIVTFKPQSLIRRMPASCC